MCPIPFYQIIRGSKVSERARYRLALIRHAQKHGVKPAARAFATSPQTIRKWLRRWDGTLASLQDHSRAPHHCPHRIDPQLEREIVQLRKKLHTYGALRLKELFNLPCSEKAIGRVLRQHGLIKPRRTRRRKKNDLRAVKAQMEPFQRVHLDSKHLYDIAEYLPAMKAKGLPRYQYTFREPVSGLQFVAYSQELAGLYAELFAERILAHLADCGVSLASTTWQTDNGAEFIGSWNATESSGFTRAIEATRARHRTIPPGAYTYQSDVETVHSRIEDELYRLEPFHSRSDFLRKTATYQLFFNSVRPNSSKGARSPWHILHLRCPKLPPRITLLPPVFLEDTLALRLHPSPGGNHVGSYPCFRAWAPASLVATTVPWPGTNA